MRTGVEKKILESNRGGITPDHIRRLMNFETQAALFCVVSDTDSRSSTAHHSNIFTTGTHHLSYSGLGFINIQFIFLKLY
jgi:hypothetical protein